MQTIHVPPDFPLNRRMRKAVRRGKLTVVREGGPVAADPNGGGAGANGAGEGIAKSHVWHPITDMPVRLGDEARTAERDMAALAAAWKKRRTELDPQKAEKFRRELNREWAIETGLIEFAYYLERGTTQLLIERGFEAGLIPHRNGQDPAEVVAMLHDHSNVLAALYDFAAGDRELSIGFIKRLHAEMLRSQKTVAGVDQFGNKTRVPMNHGLFKKRPNNPHTPDGRLHEYCPWEQVDSEMERLMEMNRAHAAHSPLARAAWLHHRFVQIHPFEDGNGRVARCLASLVFIRAGLFPMVVLNEQRGEYLDALDAADRGDLSPFIRRLAEWQKRAYLKITFTEKVEEAKRMMLEVRAIPSDAAAKVLSKIEIARKLLLLGDEFARAKGAGFSEGRRVGIDIEKLENIRRMAERADSEAFNRAPEEERRKMLSECGELAVGLAEEGMFRVLLARRN